MTYLGFKSYLLVLEVGGEPAPPPPVGRQWQWYGAARRGGSLVSVKIPDCGVSPVPSSPPELPENLSSWKMNTHSNGNTNRDPFCVPRKERRDNMEARSEMQKRR